LEYPAYDAEADLVYVTTGNNYTAPATETSDAFVALNGTNVGEHGSQFWSGGY
jgi:hypothetical protein